MAQRADVAVIRCDATLVDRRLPTLPLNLLGQTAPGEPVARHVPTTDQIRSGPACTVGGGKSVSVIPHFYAGGYRKNGVIARPEDSIRRFFGAAFHVKHDPQPTNLPWPARSHNWVENPQGNDL